MGFIGDVFSGDKGAGWQASGTPITGDFSQGGANESYNNALSGVQQQQTLAQALAAQNGLGNQSNVYGQLQGVANGTGPNPAQAGLNQATGQNIANQAALMASQRGVSANPGMIARQAAQQGANTQQQAAGQAATLQANQSLGALGQMGGLANQQVANQIGALAGYNNAAQGQENIYNQGIAAQNNANVAMQSNKNSTQGNIANSLAQGQQAITGGLIKSMSSLPQMAKGGPVQKFAFGGLGLGSLSDLAPAAPADTGPTLGIGSLPTSPQSSFGSFLNSGTDIKAPDADPASQGPAATSVASSSGNPGAAALGDAFDFSNRTKGMGKMLAFLNKGGEVPALVSPGERYLSPDEVKQVASGNKRAIDAGEKIPGKPKVGGDRDSYKNDTVRKTLESGGVVLPRHVTQSKNPAKEAEKFVAAVLSKQRLGK